MRIASSLLLCITLFLPSPLQAASFLKYFTFSEKGVLKLWKEKIHKGKVEYKIIRKTEEAYVHAHSKQAASGIYYEFADNERYNPTQRPYISWKWKVNKFPKKNPTEPQDDYAARVYVIFPANIFIFSRCIEYVWDDTLPEGTIMKSPLTPRIKIFVLQKGEKSNWIQEERNIFEDYMKAFETDEVDDEIGAIAFMSDTDDTESEAITLFDEMKIGYARRLFIKTKK